MEPKKDTLTTRPRLRLNQAMTDKLKFICDHYRMERCEMIYKLINDEFFRVQDKINFNKIPTF